MDRQLGAVVAHDRDDFEQIGADGSGLRHLLKAPQGVRIFPGAWSPDGKAIMHQQSSLRSLVRVYRAGRITTVARVARQLPIAAEGNGHEHDLAELGRFVHGRGLRAVSELADELGQALWPAAI